MDNGVWQTQYSIDEHENHLYEQLVDQINFLAQEASELDRADL